MSDCAFNPMIESTQCDHERLPVKHGTRTEHCVAEPQLTALASVKIFHRVPFEFQLQQKLFLALGSQELY